MKFLLLCALLLSCAFAFGSQTYSNIDDSTSGWGSCTDPSCAGGQNPASAYWMAQFQSKPSLDGNSTEFYIANTSPYANALFWNKLGANDAVTHFQFSFGLRVDSASTAAQALEFDTFQFVAGQEYMFGTECNYAAGVWDVWNGGANQWVHTSVSCAPFAPNKWHHVSIHVHRTSDTMMHFDTLTVDGVVYTLHLTEPSGPLPSGWSENMGVQFQLDTPATDIAFHEWVDKVNLTVW